MSTQAKKHLWLKIAIIVLGVGVVTFIVVKVLAKPLSLAKKPGVPATPPAAIQTQLNQAKSTSTQPKTATQTGFPLQLGSKGDLVKALQNVLLDIYVNPLPKYGADGDFGQETLSALQFATGKTSIADQTDYDNTVASMYANANSAAVVNPTGLSAAQTICTQYNYDSVGQYKSIQANDNVTFYGYTTDNGGLLTGNNFNLSSGQKISLNDYVPDYTDTDGWLVILKTSDSSLYKVDATAISLSTSATGVVDTSSLYFSQLAQSLSL